MQPIIALALLALALALACRRDMRSLLIDSAYGCGTRRALERAWGGRGVVLFFDIDDMHALNDAYDYEGVDQRIRSALTAACRKGEATAYRWASGDEFAVTLPSPAVAALVQRRLEAELAARGITAMYGAAVARRSLVATVKAASDQVQAQKRARDAERRAAGIATR